VVREFKSARDQTKINEAVKKHRSSSGRGGGRGRASGRGRGRGGGNGNQSSTTINYTTNGAYRRPVAGEKTRSISGNTHYPCGKCGWNTSHSSAYHSNGIKDPRSFVMPDSYLGVAATAASSLTASTTDTQLLAAAKADGKREALLEMRSASVDIQATSTDIDEAAAGGLLSELISLALK
jgi:hypothetical protein